MTQLRRIAQGPFSEKRAVTIDKLSEKKVISAEDMVKKVSPIIFVTKDAEEKLRQGKFLEASDIVKIKGKFEKGQVAAAFSNNDVIALVRPLFSSRQIKKKEGKVLKPERIL